MPSQPSIIKARGGNETMEYSRENLNLFDSRDLEEREELPLTQIDIKSQSISIPSNPATYEKQDLSEANSFTNDNISHFHNTEKTSFAENQLQQVFRRSSKMNYDVEICKEVDDCSKSKYETKYMNLNYSQTSSDHEHSKLVSYSTSNFLKNSKQTFNKKPFHGDIGSREGLLPKDRIQDKSGSLRESEENDLEYRCSSNYNPPKYETAQKSLLSTIKNPRFYRGVNRSKSTNNLQECSSFPKRNNSFSHIRRHQLSRSTSDVYNDHFKSMNSAYVYVHDILPTPKRVSIQEMSLAHPIESIHDDGNHSTSTESTNESGSKQFSEIGHEIKSNQYITEHIKINPNEENEVLQYVIDESDSEFYQTAGCSSCSVDVDGKRLKIRKKLRRGYRYSKKALLKTKVGFHFYTMTKRRWKTLILFCLVPTWILFWTVFYMCIERWTLVESLYFVIQAFTTVGFGDILPITTLGMSLFPIASIGGIAFTAATVSNIGIYMGDNLNWVKIKTILLIFIVVILLASMLFMLLEDWGWAQSLFFLYSCASTTGLSEEVPKTSAGRIAFCLLMMIFFSLFSTLIKLIVDHLRKGSDAEVVEAEEMSRSVLANFIKTIFDDD